METVQENVANIYNNEFLPSLHNLQSALESSKIKWFYETLLQVSIISSGATAFLPTLVGMSIPQALIAAAGITIVAKKTVFNQDKADKFRNSPYSYMLSVQKEFNREPPMRNIIT